MSIRVPTTTAQPAADPAFDLLVDGLIARLQESEAVDWPAIAREHPELLLRGSSSTGTAISTSLAETGVMVVSRATPRRCRRIYCWNRNCPAIRRLQRQRHDAP